VTAKLWASLAFVLTLVFTPGAVFAHHAFAANFDVSDIVEIDGRIDSVIWRNPHVRLKVIVGEGTDQEQLWDIETHSLSNLSRMDINRDVLVSGVDVKIAGAAARRKANAMFMMHMLLPDGREVIFDQGRPARFTDNVIGTSDVLRGKVVETDPSKRPTTMFAVWTTDYSNPGSWPLFPLTSENHPLTEEAKAKMDVFDIDRDNPLANCTPKGMPSAMAQPYPIQLVDADDRILLKIEEYDAVREIYLSDTHNDQYAPASHLGYSTGRWDGDTLIVTTTKIDFGYLDVLSLPKAIPQSPDVHVIETFRLREGGNELDYTMTVTDSATLTEPMTFSKYWQWRTGAKVMPFECDPE